jgi:hypothetical protein
MIRNGNNKIMKNNSFKYLAEDFSKKRLQFAMIKEELKSQNQQE